MSDITDRLKELAHAAADQNWGEFSMRVPADHARDADLVLLAASKEITSLRAELERERMRLAACGVVAMANTPESAARARDIHPDYRSASCDDVARAVDSEMSLRAELASWQEAFGLLTTLHGSIQIDSSDPMGMAKQIESHVRATIEAALAGGEK